MGMAGHRWLIPSAQGLLLCICALHLCVQDPLAAAEHNAASNTSVVAPTNASVAPKASVVAPNTTVAPKASVVAPNTTVSPKASVVAPNTTVAPKASVVAPNTTVSPKASVVAPNTTVSPKASVVVPNTTVSPKASVVVPNTTVAPKASVVAPNTTVSLKVSVLSPNTTVAPKASVVAPKALVIPTNASVVPKTSVVPSASETIPSTSVTIPSTSVTIPSTSMTIPSASVNIPSASETITKALVATNASTNGTEAMKLQLTCQSFQCSGQRCYQDGAHTNKTVTCHNETYCELYRFSSTNYTARCSSACGSGMCRTNGSVSIRECALDCCNSSLCLQLNASSYGDLPPATTPPMTTTSRAPPQNGKVCAAFSCHGDGCFKGKKAVARCSIGQDFCEMKKMGLNYMAGCSKACKAAKPVCAAGMKAACYQECCPATLRASCLRLDGKVHISGAGPVIAAPLLKPMVWGVVLLLTSRGSASLWG